MLGYNKRKSIQEALYVVKDPIETTHEYDYIGINFYSHAYFMQRIASMKALTGNLQKALVGVTCWEPKSHLFNALVLPTLTYGAQNPVYATPILHAGVIVLNGLL